MPSMQQGVQLVLHQQRWLVALVTLRGVVKHLTHRLRVPLPRHAVMCGTLRVVLRIGHHLYRQGVGGLRHLQLLLYHRRDMLDHHHMVQHHLQAMPLVQELLLLLHLPLHHQMIRYLQIVMALLLSLAGGGRGQHQVQPQQVHQQQVRQVHHHQQVHHQAL